MKIILESQFGTWHHGVVAVPGLTSPEIHEFPPGGSVLLLMKYGPINQACWSGTGAPHHPSSSAWPLKGTREGQGIPGEGGSSRGGPGGDRR